MASLLQGAENPCRFCEVREEIEVESISFCVECDAQLCEKCDKLHLLPSMSQHQLVPIPRGTREKGDVKAPGKFESASISLKLRGVYEVGTDGDFVIGNKYEVNITGICVIDTSVTIITDFDNNNIKELDSSYKVVRSLNVGKGPTDVCSTIRKEVAVLLGLQKSVQFVRVGARLKKTRSFPVGDYCQGIAYSRGELFVCCGSDDDTQDRLRVFSLEGSPLRTIIYDIKGQPIFSNAHNVTVSACGNQLYVTDSYKGVIIVDRQHQVVGEVQHCHDGTPSARGICFLADENLLVTQPTDHSQNFLHMSKDGKVHGVVHKVEGGGFWNIHAIGFDRKNRRVIVATNMKNTISVYDLM